jgi:hypothetical protein
MNACPDCGKPLYEDGIHTCTPLALKLADEIEDWWMDGLEDQAADELRRLHAENEALREALKLAKTNIADWGSYASEYFQSKHDLQGDLDSIDRALARAGEKT